MTVKEQPTEKQETGRSLAKLFAVSNQAMNIYFELVALQTAITKEEFQEKFVPRKSKAEKFLKELQISGLVRQNPDDTLEAVSPIEAVVMVLTRVRSMLRDLRNDLPTQVAAGVPSISEKVQQQTEVLPEQLTGLRGKIDVTIDQALQNFQNRTIELQATPTFESFTEELRITLVKLVEERMNQTRDQLDDFESIDAFSSVLNKLKNDVFDIVSISLSDMREQAFRLHELEEFHETLSELWNVTPGIVEEHLTSFEQEMSTLESSLGYLMETKYRLGAFKGVIENFTNEHIMTTVKTLKTNFQLSLTEAIQDHLLAAQQRYEKVSIAAQKEFEKLKTQLADWVKNALDLAFGEVIQRNQEAATNLAQRLDGLTQTFQTEFHSGLDDSITHVKLQARELDDLIEKLTFNIISLHEKEISPKLNRVFKSVDKQLTKITHDLPKTFNEWRNTYLENVEGQISTIFEQAENQMTIATQSLNQVWQRSKESEPSTFELYNFIIGEQDFLSQMTSLIARARKHLFLVLPRAVKIKTKLLNMIPGDVRVRIVLADGPESAQMKRIRKMADKIPNFQLRHDPRGDVWGAIRDFEEIIIGNTSKGTTNIIGISSSHEDHVELLRSVMEMRWLHARTP